MAIRVSGALIIISVIFSIFTGNTELVSEAAFDGCNKAVTISLSLVGLMCLWSGIMEVARCTGVLKFISKLLMPFIKLIFPEASKSRKGVYEISAAITANILGVGNACTPLAINAMKALSDKSGRASDDMVTFTVLGTAFPCLVPTTVIALRQSAGSASPTDILIPVWICSTLLSIFSVIICKLFSSFTRPREVNS